MENQSLNQVNYTNNTDIILDNNICDKNTLWKTFYFFAEYITLIIIIVLYIQAILNIYRNKEKTEKIDNIIVALSFSQLIIYTILEMFDLNYFLILVYELLKFSENQIIGGLIFFQIMLKMNYNFAIKFSKIFFVFTIGIDILTFIGGLSFESKTIEYKELVSVKFATTIIIAFIGLSCDLSILIITIVKYFKDKKEIEKQSLEILLDDSYRLDNIIHNYENKIVKMKIYYYIIIISYAISYAFNLFSNLFYNETVCFTDNKMKFGFNDFLLDYVMLIILRIIPHLCIYLGILVYKPELRSRNSSFIQIV